MKKLLSLVVLAVCATSLRAEEAVLKATKGTVQIRPSTSKVWMAASPGQAIKTNDQVRLGSGSRAQVDFESGATLLVKENSRFTLRRDKHGRLVAFKVGEFLIGLKKKLNGKNRFRVRTPVAVASVRGTAFWGQVEKNTTTTFACFTGAIDIWAQGKNVLLEPGNTTTIQPNQAPAAPQPSTVSPDFIHTFEIDGSLGGVDTVIQEESHQ